VSGRSAAIIGAGIGGLTAALTLHRAGWAARVYEAVGELKPLGVGINLLPHSVKELLALGLQDALDATAIRTGTLSYYAKNGKLIWSEPRGLDAGYPCAQYSIHRGELQMLLLAAVHRELGPQAVVTGHRLERFEQDETGVVLRFAPGSVVAEVRADCMIAADGIMSTVRKGLYPSEGTPSYQGQVLWRGVSVQAPFLDGRTMVMVGNDARKAVIYPIAERPGGKQLINWIAERAIPKELPGYEGDWSAPGKLSDFLPYFEDWRFDWLDIPALFANGERCWEFPMIDRDPIGRWTFDRVTLLGDAAHAMRPNGSNGASQGILDAVTLAACLAGVAGGSHEQIVAALTDYEQQRLAPTTQLTLTNRRTGPEIVLRMVEERCPDGFDDINDYFSNEELRQIADSYKQLAGFSKEQVRAGMKTP
jgi:2-polyprenyl-6-methoxyphenol hydroxylase-like FAD-dependent oxidoreductase